MGQLLALNKKIFSSVSTSKHSVSACVVVAITAVVSVGLAVCLMIICIGIYCLRRYAITFVLSIMCLLSGS